MSDELKPVAAIEQLTNHQQQADMDGTFVTVSRQALDEVLAYVTRAEPLRAAPDLEIPPDRPTLSYEALAGEAEEKGYTFTRADYDKMFSPAQPDAEVARLTALLNGRDTFIVNQGLFPEFVAALEKDRG